MNLTHGIHVYNEFTEVRLSSLHFDSIINLTHYESISVTWANKCQFLPSLRNQSIVCIANQLTVSK